MSYAQYLQQQLRKSYVYEYSLQHRTAQNERLICTAAVTVAAVMELLVSCQRCYNTFDMYHVQYL